MSNFTFEIRSQKALCEAFWNENPHCATLRRKGRSQNEQVCDVRACWVDFVDGAQKSGRISQTLANKATLKG